MDEPRLIEGGLAVDDRGSLAFVNAFSLEGIKRFYVVSNHRAGFVRAWHAHKLEGKNVIVVAGAAIVCTVQINNWECPSKDMLVHRVVLSAAKPAIFQIPPGYANGFMTLTADTKLLFFSTASIEECHMDDFRYDAYYWNPWQIEER